MPIRTLLEGGVFAPDEIALLVEAFDRVCRTLDVDRTPDDPLRTTIAIKVIFAFKSGARDPTNLYQQAINLTLENL